MEILCEIGKPQDVLQKLGQTTFCAPFHRLVGSGAPSRMERMHIQSEQFEKH